MSLFSISQKIEDKPLDGTDVYIVMLGEFPEQTYIDLIKNHDVPIASITYFFPEEWMKKIRYIRCYRHISRLSNAMETKNVRVHAEFLPFLSECLAKRYAIQLNNDLTYFFYDNEVMLNRNYQVFLNNFKEFDVELKGKCRPFQHANHVENWLTTYVNIYNFYEDIVDQIYVEPTRVVSEVRETFDRISGRTKFSTISIQNRESFLSNSTSQKTLDNIQTIQSNVGSTVFEEANFLKICLSFNEELAVGCSGIEWMFIEKMVNDIESCEIKRDLRKIVPEDESFYYEPLTIVALAQRLRTILSEYHFVHGFACFRSWKALVFEKRHNHVHHSMKEHYLNTKVCFKDYAKYVFPKNPTLIEEPLNSVASDKVSPFTEKNFKSEFNYNDFIRLRSLKKKVPDLSGAMLSGKAKEQDGSYLVKAMSEVDSIEGYNLADTYVQLTEWCTELYTPSGSLRLVMNSWLYKHKEMEAHLTILRNKFIFNRIFDKEGRKKMSIITFNKIVICVDFVDRKPKVSIIWPNGRMIKNLEFKQDPSRQFIEVRSKKREQFEQKRVYMSDGSLISFLLDRKAAIVCRYNGLVMGTSVTTLDCRKDEEEEESMKSGKTLTDEECEGESCEREPYKFELEWMRKAGDLFGIDGRSFCFQASTGKCFEVHCSQITEHNHTFAKHINDDYGHTLHTGGKIIECGEQGATCTWTCSADELVTNHRLLGKNVAMKTKTLDVEPLLDWKLREYCILLTIIHKQITHITLP